MGEAKRRGTYEERKRAAMARDALVVSEIAQRKPSPKHLQLMATVAGIIASMAPGPTREVE